MGTPTRDEIMAWVRDHTGRRIRLRGQGGSLAVTGRCTGLMELDACSTEFSESQIDVGTPGVEVSLTFHENSLALYFLVIREDSSRASVSVPVTLLYADVIVEELTEEAEDSSSSAKSPAKELARSPYELLHQES